MHWKILSNGCIRRHVACYHSVMRVIAKAIKLGFFFYHLLFEITVGSLNSFGDKEHEIRCGVLNDEQDPEAVLP